MTSKPTKAIGALLISALTLSACSQAQMQTFANDLRSIGSAYGPLIEDECSRFRQPFQQVAAERRERIAEYAQIGAALGASAGVATSDGSLGDMLGRGMVGALAGAVIGAAGGYFQNLQARTNTRAELQDAVNGDARGDVSRVTALTASLVELNGCRTRQIASLTNAVATGSLSREEATAQLRRIRTASLQDDRIIRDTTGQIGETTSIYVSALDRADVRDEETYVAQIQRYEPQVTRPRLTTSSSGGTVAGALALTSRAPATADPVVELGFRQNELSAAQLANAEAIDSMLDEAEALLQSI